MKIIQIITGLATIVFVSLIQGSDGIPGLELTLLCKVDSMDVIMNFQEPFSGVIVTIQDPTKQCVARGKNSSKLIFSIPINACGTLGSVGHGFNNSIRIQEEESLITVQDEFWDIDCLHRTSTTETESNGPNVTRVYEEKVTPSTARKIETTNSHQIRSGNGPGTLIRSSTRRPIQRAYPPDKIIVKDETSRSHTPFLIAAGPDNMVVERAKEWKVLIVLTGIGIAVLMVGAIIVTFVYIRRRHRNIIRYNNCRHSRHDENDDDYENNNNHFNNEDNNEAIKSRRMGKGISCSGGGVGRLLPSIYDTDSRIIPHKGSAKTGSKECSEIDGVDSSNSSNHDPRVMMEENILHRAGFHSPDGNYNSMYYHNNRNNKKEKSLSKNVRSALKHLNNNPTARLDALLTTTDDYERRGKAVSGSSLDGNVEGDKEDTDSHVIIPSPKIVPAKSSLLLDVSRLSSTNADSYCSVDGLQKGYENYGYLDGNFIKGEEDDPYFAVKKPQYLRKSEVYEDDTKQNPYTLVVNEEAAVAADTDPTESNRTKQQQLIIRRKYADTEEVNVVGTKNCDNYGAMKRDDNNNNNNGRRQLMSYYSLTTDWKNYKLCSVGKGEGIPANAIQDAYSNKNNDNKDDDVPVGWVPAAQKFKKWFFNNHESRQEMILGQQNDSIVKWNETTRDGIGGISSKTKHKTKYKSFTTLDKNNMASSTITNITTEGSCDNKDFEYVHRRFKPNNILHTTNNTVDLQSQKSQNGNSIYEDFLSPFILYPEERVTPSQLSLSTTNIMDYNLPLSSKYKYSNNHEGGIGNGPLSINTSSKTRRTSQSSHDVSDDRNTRNSSERKEDTFTEPSGLLSLSMYINPTSKKGTSQRRIKDKGGPTDTSKINKNFSLTTRDNHAQRHAISTPKSTTLMTATKEFKLPRIYLGGTTMSNDKRRYSGCLTDDRSFDEQNSEAQSLDDVDENQNETGCDVSYYLAASSVRTEPPNKENNNKLRGIKNSLNGDDDVDNGPKEFDQFVQLLKRNPGEMGNHYLAPSAITTKSTREGDDTFYVPVLFENDEDDRRNGYNNPTAIHHGGDGNGNRNVNLMGHQSGSNTFTKNNKNIEEIPHNLSSGNGSSKKYHEEKITPEKTVITEETTVTEYETVTKTTKRGKSRKNQGQGDKHKNLSAVPTVSTGSSSRDVPVFIDFNDDDQISKPEIELNSCSTRDVEGLKNSAVKKMIVKNGIKYKNNNNNNNNSLLEKNETSTEVFSTTDIQLNNSRRDHGSGGCSKSAVNNKRKIISPFPEVNKNPVNGMLNHLNQEKSSGTAMKTNPTLSSIIIPSTNNSFAVNFTGEIKPVMINSSVEESEPRKTFNTDLTIENNDVYLDMSRRQNGPPDHHLISTKFPTTLKNASTPESPVAAKYFQDQNIVLNHHIPNDGVLKSSSMKDKGNQLPEKSRHLEKNENPSHTKPNKLNTLLADNFTQGEEKDVITTTTTTTNLADLIKQFDNLANFPTTVTINTKEDEDSPPTIKQQVNTIINFPAPPLGGGPNNAASATASGKNGILKSKLTDVNKIKSATTSMFAKYSKATIDNNNNNNKVLKNDEVNQKNTEISDETKSIDTTTTRHLLEHKNSLLKANKTTNATTTSSNNSASIRKSKTGIGNGIHPAKTITKNLPKNTLKMKDGGQQQDLRNNNITTNINNNNLESLPLVLPYRQSASSKFHVADSATLVTRRKAAFLEKLKIFDTPPDLEDQTADESVEDLNKTKFVKSRRTKMVVGEEGLLDTDYYYTLGVGIESGMGGISTATTGDKKTTGAISSNRTDTKTGEDELTDILIEQINKNLSRATVKNSSELFGQDQLTNQKKDTNYYNSTTYTSSANKIIPLSTATTITANSKVSKGGTKGIKTMASHQSAMITPSFEDRKKVVQEGLVLVKNQPSIVKKGREARGMMGIHATINIVDI